MGLVDLEPAPTQVSETAAGRSPNSDILTSITWIPTKPDPTKPADETSDWVTRFMPGLKGILPKPSSQISDLKAKFVGLKAILNFRVPVNTETVRNSTLESRFDVIYFGTFLI